MEEEFQVIRSCLVIRMPKELDHYQAERIRQVADEQIDGREISHVIFDFEQTEFMDSSGIGVIMGRYKKIACFGGKVMAIHVNPRMQKIFRISGLHKLVEVIK